VAFGERGSAPGAALPSLTRPGLFPQRLCANPRRQVDRPGDRDDRALRPALWISDSRSVGPPGPSYGPTGVRIAPLTTSAPATPPLAQLRNCRSTCLKCEPFRIVGGSRPPGPRVAGRGTKLVDVVGPSSARGLDLEVHRGGRRRRGAAGGVEASGCRLRPRVDLSAPPLSPRRTYRGELQRPMFTRGRDAPKSSADGRVRRTARLAL